MTNVYIQKPTEFLKEELSDTKFRYSISPLQKGYGQTIGNCLRRVLLSSVKGHCVKKIRIPSVSCEFSTIYGVKQNVTEIMLNLKKLAISSSITEEFSFKLSVNGPKKVYASDIKSTKFEIKNPDLFLFEISDSQNFEIEIFVEQGIGYKSSEEFLNELSGNFNEIYFDCYYNPVKDVKLSVFDARVDQDINYDKIVLEVLTNGTVNCSELISEVSSYISDFFNIFVDKMSIVKSKSQESKIKKTKDASPEVDDNMLKLCLKVNLLDLSVRSYNCLEIAEIVYIGDLVQKTESELLNIQNLGRKSLNEIKKALELKNLEFGMKNIKWPVENIEQLEQEARLKFNI